MYYWGNKAVGCLFYARKTGRFGITLRSSSVEQPGTYGIAGGKLDGDEEYADALQREIGEELEFDIRMAHLEELDKYVDRNFTYITYLGIVEDEFEPVLDWENSDFVWVKLDNLPSPLHFGLKAALSKPAVMTKLKNLSKKKKIKEEKDNKKKAAGCIFVSKNGKIGLGLRSENGAYPNTWGVIGGMVESGETVKEGVVREAKEEAGIELSEDKLVFLLTTEDEKNLEYTHFIYPVDKEFKPKLNNEHDDFKWFTLENIPENTILNLGEVIENNKDRLKKYMSTDESTTTGSVGSYEQPLFGGKPMKRKISSPFSQPVSETFEYGNKPYWKGGKLVRINKKCKTYPYCNQGASKKANYAETDASNEPTYTTLNGEDFFNALKEGHLKYINLLSKPIYRGEAYRSDSGFSLPNTATAADVVRFEQNNLGNKHNVNAATLKELEDFSWDEVIWICPTLECVKHYAVTDLEDAESDDADLDYDWKENVEDITKYVRGGRILAGDSQDGYLIFTGKISNNSKSITESALYRAMDSGGKGGFPGYHFATSKELAKNYGKSVANFSLQPDAKIVNITSPEARELLKSWGILSKDALRRKARALGIDGIVYDHNKTGMDGIVVFNTRKVKPKSNLS